MTSSKYLLDCGEFHSTTTKVEEDPGEEYQKMTKIRQDLGTVKVKILSQNRPKMDEIGEKYGK